MSREIKFRAWDKITKQIFEVTEINFNAIERNVYGIITYKSILGGVNESISFRSFDNVELMQFTGLKDCNGKEIYEGDIIKAKTVMVNMPIWIGEVMRECDFYGVEANQDTGWVIVNKKLNSCMAFYPKQEREIIGNIYENSELLK